MVTWLLAQKASNEEIYLGREKRLSQPLAKIAATGIAVALCLVVDIVLDTMGIKTPYLAFMPAIIGSCALGGFGSALWATFFSCIGLWAFFIPREVSGVPSYGDTAHFAVFIGISLFSCWVIDGLKRANEQLERDNVALGFKVSLLLNRRKARHAQQIGADLRMR